MRPIRPRARNAPAALKTPSKTNTAYNNNSNESPKLQDPVEVYCRIKPLVDNEDSSCVSLSSTRIVTVTPPDTISKSRKTIQCIFKHVFTEHNKQREVFDRVALPLLEGLIQGKNGLLFTYGVTGSGKTYTMTGEPNDPGIMPRCIDVLFNTINGHQAPKYVVKSDRMNGFEVQSDSDAQKERLHEAKFKQKSLKKNWDSGFMNYSNDGCKLSGIDEDSLYSVFVSYVEIYNNAVFDLLDESSGSQKLHVKILREDSNHNMYVNGVIEVEVKSPEEAFELFSLGQRRKRMANTNLNSESSRSHSIFNIRLVHGPTDKNGEHVVKDRNMLVISQLSLVDLAGSERCSRTQNTGQRLKEAASINNSLMSLRTCLEILRENQISGTNRIVPYRECRLTHLFKNFFDGEGKVEMVICINPSSKDYDETLQVMKFAEMTQEIKIARPEPKTPMYEELHPGRRLATKLMAQATNTPSAQYLPMDKRPEVVEKIIPKACSMDPENESIKTLILFLKTRQQKRSDFSNIQKPHDAFRQRLNNFHRKILMSNSEINSLRYLINKEKQNVSNLQNKMTSLEVERDEMIRECEDKNKIINNMKSTIKEKDFKLNQNVIDKERQRKKHEAHSEKMTQELDAKLRKQRERYHATVKEKDEKIELVKEILSDKVPIPSSFNPKQSATTIEKKSEDVISYPCTKEKIDDEGQHIPRRDAPVANTRYRRSRSAGDVWLEHKPANPTPLGTVLQPVMKRRKSVTKLTDVKDVVNAKQTRYALLTQGQDKVGALQTNIYKGDIIPTCCGGAQVIFDDVEKLVQESPLAGIPNQTPNKHLNLRRAYPISDKCSVSIEGHGKKIRK